MLLALLSLLISALDVRTLGENGADLLVGERVEVVLALDDAPLPGHGPSQSFAFTSEFEGTLHVWATSAELDPFLRVEHSESDLPLQDDDSGGGKAAYLELEVKSGTGMRIDLAASKPGESGKAVLCIVASPETDATRAAARKAHGEAAKVQRLRVANELTQARKLVRQSVDDLFETKDAATSNEISRAAFALGSEAYNSSAFVPAREAYTPLLRHRVRTLPEDHHDLQTVRQNLAIARKILGDYQGARALEEQVLAIRSRTLPEDDLELLAAQANFGITLRELGDLQGARELEEHVLEVSARTQAADHPNVMTARHNLAITAMALGDFQRARSLQEQVLAVYSRTLPEDDRDLQGARNNLANTLSSLGDLQGARALRERVLDVYERKLPEDDVDLQRARGSLAATLHALGDLPGARALEEQVLEVFTRILPENHPDILAARQNLAATLLRLGDLPGARALYEQVLAVRSRTLSPDHPDLQAARQNLAAVLGALGYLEGIRVLEEQVLAVRSRTLPEDHPDLQVARVNLATTLARLGDARGARELLEQALAVLERTLPEEHSDLLLVRQNLAQAIKAQGDLAGARALEEQVLAVLCRTLPEDHPHLQAARHNLASTLHVLGDLHAARTLEEQVLAVRSRTLPEDHPDLLSTRSNLAVTLLKLGDLAAARAIQEQVLAVQSRTLPGDHPDLQAARQNLAATLMVSGELPAARALFEQVFEVRSRTLPEDHLDLQLARLDLGEVLREFGDLHGAHALFEQSLAVLSRTLPEDHPDLQKARMNLSNTLYSLGDLEGARALREQVLVVLTRTLPEDHPDLQLARVNLASTLRMLGELPSARKLEEKVLAIFSRTLPEDHPDLQKARMNFALTLRTLGDLAAARSLLERVLAVSSRTLPDEHPDLQATRLNLALMTKAAGDLAGARVLLEQVLAVVSRTHPEDHPTLQAARMNLASTLYSLGDLGGARALFEQVLAIFCRTLPVDHPDLQVARENVAILTSELGDPQGALPLLEQVLAVFSRTLPEDHPLLQQAQENLAGALIAQRAVEAGKRRDGTTREGNQGDRRYAEVASAVARSLVRSARMAVLTSSTREAEERCASLTGNLGTSLSFAAGCGVFPPDADLEREAFALSETTRSAALASARILRVAAANEGYVALRDEARAASAELAQLAQGGASHADLDLARNRRETAERDLLALARELMGDGDDLLAVDLVQLSARLDDHEALVGYRRYKRSAHTPESGARATAIESLCAQVVRAGGRLERVELGPIAPIEAAVHAWRAAIGLAVDARGISVDAAGPATASVTELSVSLRRLVFDPLLPALEGAERVIVALDDVLHLVPLDALPAPDSALANREHPSLLGDRWRIETRATLAELLVEPEPLAGSAGLVAIGGVDYGALPGSEEHVQEREHSAASPEILHAAAELPARVAEQAGVLRGGAWSAGFSELSGTSLEVRGLAQSFRDGFGASGASELLEGANATRERLLALATRARWLHVATHGWFGPESIRSWNESDEAPSGLALPEDSLGVEQAVHGMSPMLLCGLALAGANLPEDEFGRIPGLVTAEELSTLDLSNCELAVLSACDTNVGERRAGQGVASLQKALHMAGARTVITSLWKVPDEATKDLMLDFYRRLWIEKEPAHQALWHAKAMLRDARDANGDPKYSLSDWAAWVLTGEPE